jgi:predicted alpha/beta hydrolase family esterase
MSQVVVVHGIANSYGGGAQMLAGWAPALCDGVNLAGGVLTQGDITCVFYGDLFRRSGRFLSSDTGVDDLDVSDLEEGDVELLLAWWQAAAESDALVAPPELRALGPRDLARAALWALSGSRFLAGLAAPVLIWWLKQVRAYMRDARVRSEVQARFSAALSEDTRVVVAHSLGSVVAYEGLCANTQVSVTDLVTIGSPLGVRPSVFDHLCPSPTVDTVSGLCGVWPGGVQRWVNISDGADFVALEPRLRKRFGSRVVDVRIDNGVRAHQVQRYLSAAETGAAVLAGLA